MANVLGIEAARITLLREFQAIVAAASTYIDPHHIALFADAMCVTGEYLGFTAPGMARARSDVLLNASFEQQDHVVQMAALNQRGHDTSSTATSVCLGQLAPRLGTGMCELFLDVNAVVASQIVAPHVDVVESEFLQAPAARA